MNVCRTSLLLAVATLSWMGCSQVDYIEIDPSAVTFKQKNNKVWLRAKCMSHTNVHYPNEKVSWSVADPSIATVDETGRLFPVKSGTTEVVATHGKVKSSVPVTVLYSEKMTVEPKEVILTEGGSSKELLVKVFDHQGRELQDRQATFKSLHPEVVSMGQNAAFPVAAGKGQVEVRVEELTQMVDVMVEAEKSAKRK